MEWLILAVLVPAVLVPIVLLWGFAGCTSFGSTEASSSPSAPFNLKATAFSTNRIDLTWEHSSAGGVTFAVGRQRADGTWDDSHGTPSPADAKTFSDNLLDEGRFYSYRVRAISPGPPATSSDPSNVVRTRTLKWETAYDKPVNTNGGSFGGDCLVQRIDRSLLSLSGTARRVRLTLRGSTAAALALERVYISRAAPSSGIPGNVAPEPWDPDTDLTRVHDVSGGQGVLDLPANTPRVLEVDYALSTARDLTVAFDIASGTARRREGDVGASIGYLNANADEAANPNRTTDAAQWEQRPPGVSAVWIVEKIEALTAE